LAVNSEPPLKAARRPISQQSWAGEVLDLVARLDPPERSLLEAIYRQGMSAAQIARVAGLPESTVRHRVRQLVQRINSPLCRYVLRHGRDWPPLRRRIAEDVFIRGRGQRRTALDLGVTSHKVRREVDRIRILAEAAACGVARAERA
jgi:hypothetical protein